MEKTANELIKTALIRNEIVLDRLLTQVKAVRESHLGLAALTALEETKAALAALGDEENPSDENPTKEK